MLNKYIIMDRRPANLRKNRSTIQFLNDRENIRKVLQDREFNLKRRKELQKILQEQTEKLYNAQQKKVKKLKAGRGKNLRGELARNKNLQRRFERGERRYNETEEPRIVGDAAPQIVAGMGFNPAPMTPEDRQIALQRLQLQAQQQQNQFVLQDRRDREELAIRRGEAQGNLLLDQQRLAQEQEEQRARRLIDEGRINIDRDKLAREDRRLEAHEAEILANLDLELERNRLRELEIENNKAIQEEQNAIRRLQLEEEKLPLIQGGQRAQPFNIGDHQFIGNLLTGLAQDRQRERDATDNLIQKFMEHQEKVQGNVSPDLLSKLFTSAQQLGLRVVGQEQTHTDPNPPPPSYNQIDLSIDDVASNVRSILRPPSVMFADDKKKEGTQQSIGALTELELELNKPNEDLNKSIDDLQSDLEKGAEKVRRFLETAEPDIPEPAPSEVSDITPSEFARRITKPEKEWDRRVNKAEQEFDKTSEGMRVALESQRFNQDNPFALIEVENPLNQLDLTRSQISRLDKDAQKQSEIELDALKNQNIDLGNLADLQKQERELDIEQQLVDVEEEQVEQGAGLLQQAGEAVGGALVGVAGGVADLGLGVLQGAGEAVLEQLPTPGQVGQAVGRGAIDLGAGVLGAAGAAAGGIAGAVLGGGDEGRIEEIIEDVSQEGLDIDDETLLEEVPISTQSPAQIADQDFDWADFTIHQQIQSEKQRRPTLLEQQQGPKYSIQNTSDRVHKRLQPGEKVDIIAYGRDKKDPSIGFYGSLNPASNRREGQPTKLQNKALEKSLDKGYLKLFKNY